jgi:hypothetical protein
VSRKIDTCLTLEVEPRHSARQRASINTSWQVFLWADANCTPVIYVPLLHITGYGIHLNLPLFSQKLLYSSISTFGKEDLTCQPKGCFWYGRVNEHSGFVTTACRFVLMMSGRSFMERGTSVLLHDRSLSVRVGFIMKSPLHPWRKEPDRGCGKPFLHQRQGILTTQRVKRKRMATV